MGFMELIGCMCIGFKNRAYTTGFGLLRRKGLLRARVLYGLWN